MKFRTSRFVIAPLILAVTAVLAGSATAQASILLTVSVSDGTSTLDTETLTVSNLYAVTQADFAGGFATSGVEFALGGSSNVPGNAIEGNLLSNQVSVTDMASGTRIITITATPTIPFSGPGASGDTVFVRSTVTSSDNPSAIVFNSTVNGTDLALQTPPSIVLGDTLSTSFTRGLSYTLGNTTQITLVGLGTTAQSNGTTEVTAAPEPATLVLALAGLPLLAARRWLRRRS